MDESALARELLPHAVGIARQMWNDPEADSVAGWALLRALRSYTAWQDAEPTPLKKYVALCVRRDIWHTWRKLRTRDSVRRLAGVMVWTVSCRDSVELESTLTAAEWLLLHEHYIERISYSVLAARYHTPKGAIRTRILDLVKRIG